MNIVLYWSVLGLSGFTTWMNLADMWRRRRKDKRHLDLLSDQTAEKLGLTPLQIQIALDESSAAFFSRIADLQNTTKGGGSER